MKQKQVKEAPKSAKQTNAKKATPSKKAVAAAVKEVEEEVVVKKVLGTKKPGIKKAGKVQKKKVVEEVIESPEEEEEDDEVEQDIEEEEDDEEPMDEEAVDDEADEEQEDDEQEDDEQEDDEQEDDEQEDEEEDDDEEENDEEEDDDEPPTEASLDEEPTLPSKVKSGRIPPSVPIERVVTVLKLPSKCKKIDIVQAFAKYGAIEQVYIETTLRGTYANVAFKTAKAAQKAVLEANKKVKIHDSIIWVALKKPRKEKKTEEAKERFNYNACLDRSISVKYLKPGTTEDQVKEHFAACGEIEHVKVVVNKVNTVANAYVTFTDKKALPAAKKLHHTVLNKAKIGVFENTQNNQRDPKLTVILKNKQNLESIEGEKVEKIFAKCGEIVNVDIMRSKNVLAIVSFKDEEAAQKAFKMNGKTEQGIELDIGEYNQYQKKLCIYISNLPIGCTEKELTDIFSKAGEIATVFLRPNFAVITFKDTDGFCKSFLYNETKIRNKRIFVQPHSSQKRKLNRNNTPQLEPFNRKRPAQQNGSGFVAKPKKIKKN